MILILNLCSSLLLMVSALAMTGMMFTYSKMRTEHVLNQQMKTYCTFFFKTINKLWNLKWGQWQNVHLATLHVIERYNYCIGHGTSVCCEVFFHLLSKQSWHNASYWVNKTFMHWSWLMDRPPADNTPSNYIKTQKCNNFFNFIFVHTFLELF